MTHAVTCGILAGGAGSRMGTNKALLPFRGRPLLERQLGVLRPIFERVVVAASDPAPYAPFRVEVVPDLLPERCALTGIHAVLSAARTAHAFVLACDMPFLNPRLIESLLAGCETWDAVVPETEGGPEPLHAVYSRGCLAAIEACAGRGAWRVPEFYPQVRVDRRRVLPGEWEVEGRSPFLNANTPDEWRAAAP